MAIDESFSKRGDWQWHNCGERAAEISGGKERVRSELDQREKERVK